MNYIVTKNKSKFESIGEYNYCFLEDMILADVISCDSETSGLQARHNDMFCFQIGTGKNNYIIVLYDKDYTFEELIPYLKDRTLIFHNALFDLGFCYKHNFYPNDVRDTMLASKILYNGDVSNINHDFGSVMKRELGVVYDKTDQKNISTVKLSQPSTILYSFNDVDRLIELHEALEKKIDEGGYRETYDLHCKYIRALAYIEQCGMPISSIEWKNKMLEDEKNVKLFKEQIEEYIFDHFKEYRDGQIDMFDSKKRIKCSISSPLQMVKIFQKLGIETKDKDGKDSINESIISKSKHEFVPLWLKFQEANHRVTTFGEGIYSKIEKERIYTNFNPMVDTARLSVRKGNINFLNFPSDKNTRKCFVANKDNKMIVCDYSGQENVIIADFSGDAAMTSSVVNGDDLHCMLAKVLYPEIKDLSDEEIIKNHKQKRQDSKPIRFAFAYGGNAYTIHVNGGIPLQRATEIEQGFKELHEGLYTWGNKILNESIQKGYISSVDGWKLHLPQFNKFKELENVTSDFSKSDWTLYREGKLEYKKTFDVKDYTVQNSRAYEFYKLKRKQVSDYFKLKSEYSRLALNSPVQTCGGHMIKRASLLLFDWIVKNNYQGAIKICNSIYDELVLEAREDLAEIAKIQLEKCMVEAGNYYLTNLSIKAEAGIGTSWAEAK